MTKKNETQRGIEIYLPELTELIQKFDEMMTFLKSDYKYVDNELLSTKDVLKILKICNKTLQTYRNENRITFSKIGGKIYYRQSDIDKFIESNKRIRLSK